jgi:hypothetical protein
LDFTNKLPYARDRNVECSFWVLATFFEPKYSQARKIMTKTISLLSAIDDTYDSYGKIDELELFTKAIERLTTNTFSFSLGFECSVATLAFSC